MTQATMGVGVFDVFLWSLKAPWEVGGVHVFLALAVPLLGASVGWFVMGGWVAMWWRSLAPSVLTALCLALGLWVGIGVLVGVGACGQREYVESEFKRAERLVIEAMPSSVLVPYDRGLNNEVTVGSAEDWQRLEEITLQKACEHIGSAGLPYFALGPWEAGMKETMKRESAKHRPTAYPSKISPVAWGPFFEDVVKGGLGEMKKLALFEVEPSVGRMGAWFGSAWAACMLLLMGVAGRVGWSDAVRK